MFSSLVNFTRTDLQKKIYLDCRFTNEVKAYWERLIWACCLCFWDRLSARMALYTYAINTNLPPLIKQMTNLSTL